MDLSIIIPTHNESGNIKGVIFEIKEELRSMDIDYEIIVIDAHSKDKTAEVASQAGAKVFLQKSKGYGQALKEGFEASQGDYIVTMDADFSHQPRFIKEMWRKKKDAELIIASRYVEGGRSQTSFLRRVLSIALNRTFTFLLSFDIKDISSGYRLYNYKSLKEISLESRDYAILEEIIIKIYCLGYHVIEIPFEYKPRKAGRSKAKLFKFAKSYLKTLFKMWKLRNSIACADYDGRAFRSIIPLQRYWQRKRYKIIKGFLDDQEDILDIGCGTSKIIQSLPQAVGLDIQLNKLRYLRGTNRLLINGNICFLPFKSNFFKIIICSQLIEHLKEKERPFQEISRVLKRGGTLIIGTPDYGRLQWRLIGYLYDRIPRAYGDEHITHYTFSNLKDRLIERGFEPLAYKYICGAELIMKAKKIG